MKLDIEHATQSVALSQRWERLIAGLQRSTPGWAEAEALAEAMDAHAGPCGVHSGAEYWRVAARFLRALSSDREVREIARTKRGDVTAARARLAVLLHEVEEVADDVEDDALRERLLASFDSRKIGMKPDMALRALAGLTLPTLYVHSNEGEAVLTPRVQTHHLESPSKVPVLRVTAYIDGATFADLQPMQLGILHSIRFKVRGREWLEDATKLRLGLLSTCPAECYAFRLTDIARPETDQEFSVEATGHILFQVALNSGADHLVFAVQATFLRSEGDAVECAVVGNHQLHVRVLAPRDKRGSSSELLLPPPTLGIITALSHETAAVRAVFGEPPRIDVPGAGAGRAYWMAEIPSPLGGLHRVVIGQADMGNNSAAIRASLLLTHFPNVTSIVMCGIAGGIPSPHKSEDQVRLGDIVVSNQKGVVQYDSVKRTVNKKRTRVVEEIRSSPRPPSAILLEAVRILEANALLGQRPWEPYLEDGLTRLEWSRPDPSTDVLIDPQERNTSLPHPAQVGRTRGQPLVFLGPIASANILLKDSAKRDALRERFGVKAAEMEGSGVADATWSHGVGYLVVRAICDYCDMAKSDLWQRYAAVAAAAYVRALVDTMPGTSETPPH